MGKNPPRVMIAAVSSGCGKTAITCGLLSAFRRRGKRLRAFKCGPDYIDPMFHKYVLGIDGGNLDSFFSTKEQLAEQLREKFKEELTLIEGVMGYYDGIGGTSFLASSWEVAKLTKTPAVLILDGKGASLSLAAVVRGFLRYREDNGIKAVILNRTKKAVAERLRPLIEQEGVVFLGAVPECEEMRLDSRHLGLVLPEEQERLRERIEAAGQILEDCLDLDRLLLLAESAECLDGFLLPTESAECLDRLLLPAESSECLESPEQTESLCGKEDSSGKVSDKETGSVCKESLRIAVARDRAFCFYYQENLRLLEKMGARLVFFSPLDDRTPPENVCGLILGGGYPELYGERLSANHSMTDALRRLIGEEDMPVLAECGGFLYLHEQLEDGTGKAWPMAGVIKGRAYKTDRLRRFGYVNLERKETAPDGGKIFGLSGGWIRGHEFHYWDSTSCGSDWIARKPSGDRQWECMHERTGQIMGFPHLYYPSNPDFIRDWLKSCDMWREMYLKSDKGQAGGDR